MPKRAPRVWFYAPELHWYGWQTLLPWIWGSDEWHRRDLALGWGFTGRIVIALWKFKRPCDCGPECPDCGRLIGASVNGVWQPCWHCEKEDAR